MVKSGLASPLFLCKYPQENITIQRVVAKQADTLQQTARIRLAAGKGRSMRRKEEIEAYAENLFLPITQKHGFELCITNAGDLRHCQTDRLQFLRTAENICHRIVTEHKPIGDGLKAGRSAIVITGEPGMDRNLLKRWIQRFRVL